MSLLNKITMNFSYLFRVRVNLYLEKGISVRFCVFGKLLGINIPNLNVKEKLEKNKSYIKV